jgi:hypothetical protein
VKKILFVFGLLSSMTAWSQQDDSTSRKTGVKILTIEERSLRLTNHLTRMLALEPEQQPQIFRINEWYFQSLDSLKQSTATKKDKILAGHQIEVLRDERYKQVFNEAQKAAFFRHKKQDAETLQSGS